MIFKLLFKMFATREHLGKETLIGEDIADYDVYGMKFWGKVDVDSLEYILIEKEHNDETNENT